jgi:hypothetical protein
MLPVLIVFSGLFEQNFLILYLFYGTIYSSVLRRIKLPLLLLMSMGRESVSELWTPTGLLFIPQIVYENGAPVERFWQENRRTQRWTCPSAILSTTNPTWTDQGTNPSLCSERPATNQLPELWHSLKLPLLLSPFKCWVRDETLTWDEVYFCVAWSGLSHSVFRGLKIVLTYLKYKESNLLPSMQRITLKHFIH